MISQNIYKKIENLINNNIHHNQENYYDNSMSIFANVMVYLAKNHLAKDFIFYKNIIELTQNFLEDENIINYIFENENDISSIHKKDFSKIFNDILLYIHQKENKSHNHFSSLSHFWQNYYLHNTLALNPTNIYFPNFVFGEALFVFNQIDFYRDKKLYFALLNTSKNTLLLTKIFFCINEIQDISFVEDVYNDTTLYDNIITIPYYTMLEESNFQRENNEIEMIEFLLKKLTPQGKFVFGVVNSFLSKIKERNINYKNFRKYLLENDLIEAIASFPKSVSPNIGTFFSFITLNMEKKGESKNHIIFFKLPERKKIAHFISNMSQNLPEFIPTNEIKDYDLNPNKYIHPKRAFLKDELAKNKENVKKIERFIEKRILGSLIPKEYIVDILDNELRDCISYIGISDLSKDKTNYLLDIKQVKRQIDKYHITYRYNNKIIDYSVILVGLLGGKLRPTYFKYEGMPIILGTDIIALKINEKMPINIDYLIEQLQSELTQIQVEMSLVGDTLKRLKIIDLLEIDIILPSIERQKEILVNIQKEKIQQFLIENKIKEREIKDAEYDVLAITIHDLNQKLGAMQNDLHTLERFFNKKSQNNEPILVDDFVVPVLEKHSAEKRESLKLKSILQRIITTRNEASAQLNATREEIQNNTIKPEKVKIKHFFDTEIKPLYQNNITFLTEGQNIEVELDKSRIKNMVRNLIENAKTHGDATEIEFFFSYANDEDNLSIIYKNNGKPLPADFDFEHNFKRLYHKTTHSKGSGIGGYSINKTIELHSGKMQNISPKDAENEDYPFQIKFIFPILYTKNPNYVKSNSYFID